MKKIRWLHLSDIHLNKRGVDTRRMRRHLIQYLKDRQIICDYIFFTGDLRFAPAGEFSDDTVAFKIVCGQKTMKFDKLKMNEMLDGMVFHGAVWWNE